MSGLSVREVGRCVAVGRFSVAVAPRLCVSQCGWCVVSAWQLSVSRQVCLTIGLLKIMVEKPPNYSCLSLKLPPPPFAVLLVNFTGNIKVDSMPLLTHITINIGPYDL